MTSKSSITLQYGMLEEFSMSILQLPNTIDLYKHFWVK